MDDFKDDIKTIKADIGDIKKTLAVNTEILSVHIKRTQLNEDRIQKLEHWLLGLLASALIATLIRMWH